MSNLDNVGSFTRRFEELENKLSQKLLRNQVYDRISDDYINTAFFSPGFKVPNVFYF